MQRKKARIRGRPGKKPNEETRVGSCPCGEPKMEYALAIAVATGLAVGIVALGKRLKYIFLSDEIYGDGVYRD